MKLEKNTFPANHSEHDFKCFGPVANKDGNFSGTMLCDLGCFTQDGKDSNKYYFACVCQSKIDDSWYAYFEWGRTGASYKNFQFVAAYSKDQAFHEYEKQLHEKNDKRGEWYEHPSLGRMLRAKQGKDCYLVRNLASRSTGLPDARNITNTTVTSTTPTVVKTGAKKTSKYDEQTVKLLRDLSNGTVNYTRTSMSNSSIPSQDSIDEARNIIHAAKIRVQHVGDNEKDQVNDSELKELTYALYSRIPKNKPVKSTEPWILSTNNIFAWEQDIDAFETALQSESVAIQDTSAFDPFGGQDIHMEYLSGTSELGKFIYEWAPKATRNVHGNVGNIKIRNVWSVDRNDGSSFEKFQKKILKEVKEFKRNPLHQPKDRIDLTIDQKKLYKGTNTCLLFHGSRTVNCFGILKTSFKLPKQLVGVSTNGAAFGPGCYTADDIKKSVGYTSDSRGRYTGGSGGIRGRHNFIFIVDVALGTPYYCERAKGWTSAPNSSHSVFAHYDICSNLMNNEFIVYNTTQLKIRYLIEFTN